MNKGKVLTELILDNLDWNRRVFQTILSLVQENNPEDRHLLRQLAEAGMEINGSCYFALSRFFSGHRLKVVQYSRAAGDELPPLSARELYEIKVLERMCGITDEDEGLIR